MSDAGAPGASRQEGKLPNQVTSAFRFARALVITARAEVLTALFEAARVHGTTVRVRAQPAAGESPSGRAP